MIALLAAPSGCVKRAGPSVPFDKADLSAPEAIYREIRGSAERIRSLQGTAHVEVRTEERKVGLDAVIVCDRRGRLRLEVHDWLNHVVFLALFRPDGFLTYSPAENEYREGPNETGRIQEILGIPLQAEQLAALALGDPLFMPLEEPILRASLDGDALLLDIEVPGVGPRALLWLDEERNTRRVFVIPSPNRAGSGWNLQVDYGRHRKVDAVPFPHQIRIATADASRFLQVDYQRVLLNQPLEEDLFRFVPPAGATKSGG